LAGVADQVASLDQAVPPESVRGDRYARLTYLEF